MNDSVDIKRWPSFVVTNVSIILMMILGSYLSWNRYGGPGPELLLVLYAGLQILIWWLARRGNVLVAFVIPLVWFMIGLVGNIAVFAMTYGGESPPSTQPPEPPLMRAAEFAGYVTIAGLFGGYLWMAIDLGRRAMKRPAAPDTGHSNSPQS